MPTQIVMIHGGMTFKTKEDYINYLKTTEISLEEKVSWKGKYLKESLGEDFQIIKPRMPLAADAQYEEWKIIFERYLEVLNDEIILTGSSLGGTFLAKYLSENKLSENRINKKLLAVFLMAPPFDNSLPGEDLVGGFDLTEDLSLLDECTENLYLMFSKDDDVVPVEHAQKFEAKLPNAKIIIYESKGGHFQIEEFPEIVNLIKESVK